uniref:Na(+)/H(+) exchange regulatory cofactor NHE-RF1-like n=1 Tax=Oncorhynchus gorbuscha TaxID=8017 RepID=UPI001EAF1656
PASSHTAKRENGSVSKLPTTLTREVPKPTRRSPSRAAKKEALAHVNAHAQVARTPVDPSELFPRLCHLVRAETGYGFNLHSEKSRPGQYIRSLDPGSPADHAGLRPQDRLIEVNGVNVEGMRHAEVVTFIKRGGDETRLLVVDPDTDHHFKKMGVTPLASHIKDFDGPSISNGSPSPQINGSFTSSSIQSHHSDLSSPDNSLQLGEDEASRLMDPFAEIGLLLSPTAAEAKEKAHAKRAKKRAPQMDWDKNTNSSATSELFCHPMREAERLSNLTYLKLTFNIPTRYPTTTTPPPLPPPPHHHHHPTTTPPPPPPPPHHHHHPTTTTTTTPPPPPQPHHHYHPIQQKRIMQIECCSLNVGHPTPTPPCFQNGRDGMMDISSFTPPSILPSSTLLYTLIPPRESLSAGLAWNKRLRITSFF